MDILELAMRFNPWPTLGIGALLGFLLGLYVKTVWDKVQDHETRLEVRTRDVDEHTLVTGEDA